MIKNVAILNGVLVLLMLGFTINANAIKDYTNSKIYQKNSRSKYLHFQSQTHDGEITMMPMEEAIENNEELRELMFGSPPAVFVDTEGIRQANYKTPVIAYCYNNAIDKLYEENPVFKEVKAIQINIDKLSDIELDLSLLVSFDKLEYIYFSFTYEACAGRHQDCLHSIVQNMIINETKPLTVLYQLSVPE